MTTALFCHDASLAHVNPPGHPERVDRYKAIMAALAGPGFAALDRREAPVCDRTEILRCHPEAYLARIEAAIPTSGWAQLDPDTYAAPGSMEPAFRAVGGCCAAVDAVIAGDARNAFVAMRPPGHHAETARAMGFCLFGNIAIAAKRALDHHRLARVAVLDFDVHHGNGTQDLLWHERRALYCSSHQMPLYPGSGAATERGAHGNVMNMPLGAGTGGAEMRAAWGGAILPQVEAFAPELILVSAGFDAHQDDPLANLNWTSRDFAWLTREICGLAARVCDGRVVSALEGGYDLEALAASVGAHVNELMEAS